MVMMRYASNHKPLFARQPTFTQRIFASANDCLMLVTVSTTAEHGGQQPLRCRRWTLSPERLFRVAYCRSRLARPGHQLTNDVL